MIKRILKTIFLICLCASSAALADNADWNKPANDSLKSNFPGEVRAIAKSAGTMSYTSDTNIPTGAIRYNRSTDIFEEYNGSTWASAPINGSSFVASSVANASLAAGVAGTSRSNIALVSQVQDGGFYYGGSAGGSGNAQTITLTPAIPAYAEGQHFIFKSNAANSSTTTLNVNSLGTKTIKKFAGLAKYNLTYGDMRTGRIAEVVYDGTDFILLNPVGKALKRENFEGTISNTSAESDLVSASILGGTISSYGVLAIRWFGEVVNNTGGTESVIFRIKYGTTTIGITTGGMSLGTSATPMPVYIEGTISGNGATNKQRSCFRVFFDNDASRTGTTGGMNLIDEVPLLCHYSIGEDSTTDLNFKITGDMSTASNDMSIVTRHYVIEEL